MIFNIMAVRHFEFAKIWHVVLYVSHMNVAVLASTIMRLRTKFH